MGSTRYEGNSRFGADHKWGLFPALSAAWRLSEEGFVRRLPWVNDLKLRAGYGVTGIAPTSSYLSLTSYSYGQRFLYNGQWVQGLAPARNRIPTAVGGEARGQHRHRRSMFGSRLRLGDVYRRETRDMLYNYSVPVPPYLFGTFSPTSARCGTTASRRRWRTTSSGSRSALTTSANWSRNTNQRSRCPTRPSNRRPTASTGAPVSRSSSPRTACVGQPIGNFFGWQSVDIDTSGKWIVL